MNGTTDFDATVDFILVDAGEPGVDDTARIEIKDGDGNLVLFVEGPLNKGNFQTHRSERTSRGRPRQASELIGPFGSPIVKPR